MPWISTCREKTSRNEENRFVGKINRFQPSTDITPTSLKKEVSEVHPHLTPGALYAVENFSIESNVEKVYHFYREILQG